MEFENKSVRAIQVGRSIGRLLLVNNFDHFFAEGVADEEVALGISKPMMAVTGVGGKFLGAGELGGFDKAGVQDF